MIRMHASLRTLKQLLSPAVVAVALIAAGTTAAVAVQDAEGPTTRPRRAVPSGQVVRPYNLLDDLTAEQAAQLRALRGEYLVKLREIEDEWHAGSLAVLTAEQRQRLDELEAERRQEAAQRRAERRRQRQQQEPDTAGDEGMNDDGGM